MLKMKNQIRLAFRAGGGGLLMHQSNPCFNTKGGLTKPYFATSSNIFSNVCAKSLKCIEVKLLHHFFQRDTSFVTVANEWEANMKVGELLPLKVYPATKMGISITVP